MRFFLLAVIAIFPSLHAQGVVNYPDAVYTRDNTDPDPRIVSSYQDGIVPSARQIHSHAPHYAYVREADLMYAKRIWRVIDFREKINQYFIFPLTESNNRINLITILQKGIQEEALTPFDPYEGDDFKVQMSREDALKLGCGWDTVPVYNHLPPYEWLRDTVIQRNFDGMTVKKLRIKEDWFFDMKRSVMEVRIVGICPVMEVIDLATGEKKGEMPMYWIHFDQARSWLAGFRIYNPWNYAQRITYDDAFQKRFFNSLIYKQDNVQDRRIAEYEQGVDALLEAEKIKNDLMLFEHDVWEQ
jgi:gliding motility associated protien GldN